MSKPKRKRPAPGKQKKRSKVNPESWLQHPDHSSSNDGTLRKLFLGLAAFVLLVTLALAWQSGINADDEYQNDYSEKLVNYYTSFGADTAALHIPKGNMHYYGGVFDILSGLTNRAFGLGWTDAGYHRVRHVYNALFGFLLLFFAALLGRQIAGWRAGILALLFLFLSPRLLGHSLMNPKDIPFAAGYVVAIYYTVIFFKNMPRPRWQHGLGIALGIALAIGTRAGGMLLIAYLVLYAGLDYLLKRAAGRFPDAKQAFFRFAMWTLAIALVGYLLAVLCWPWALQAPLTRPFEALGEFSSLGVKIRVLFQGENAMSDQTSWDYPLQWIWRTIPLFVLVGFTGSLFLLRRLFWQYPVLPVFLLYFASVFPVGYVIYKDSILHDGWRHLLFVYPTMAIVAALFWLQVERLVSGSRFIKIAVYVVLGLMLLEPALFIVRNPHVPYIFFNTVSGGLSSAFGKFETDYWGISMKQAVEELESQGILKPDMTDTVTIATSYSYVLQAYTTKRYNGKVKVLYQRFNSRYERPWDYGIFPSRYIKGPHLRAGTWPNSRTAYTISANGIPLTAIEKGGGYVFEAEQYFKAQNWQAAAQAFELETQEHPDNELAWMKLAMAQLNLGKYAEARHAAGQMLRVAPRQASGLLYQGLAALNLGDAADAERDFLECVRIEGDFANAWYYLALIKRQRNDLNGALQDLQKAIDASPQFRAAYELAAAIYDQQGNAEQAKRFRQAIGQ